MKFLLLILCHDLVEGIDLMGVLSGGKLESKYTSVENSYFIMDGSVALNGLSYSVRERF